MTGDRNFDDLAPRFRRKVYDGLKGQIRLAVLKKDTNDFFPRALAAGGAPLHVLDAGGGHGPFSIGLAKYGHRITLCDLSKNMLDQARQSYAAAGLEDSLHLLHGPIQDLPDKNNGPYDLILCHAVLEWVENPKGLISDLISLMIPGGVLSLTFYNLTAMIYKNLLRTNYQKILNNEHRGTPGGLTPTWPRKPEQVLGWLSEHPFNILCHSGIRVFHDYILDIKDQKKDPDTVLKLELELSRQPPFRDLGRYQHILGIKMPDNKTPRKK